MEENKVEIVEEESKEIVETPTEEPKKAKKPNIFKRIFNKENFTKEKVTKNVKKYLILTIANILLALSTVLFFNPLTIVSGGLTGIAIIIDNLIPGSWLDIILYCGEGVLMILSFIFLGKKTTFKSLYSCIICPLFVTLFTRVIPISSISNLLYGWNGATYTLAQDTSLLLLGGVVGGILVGVAVGLAFMVGGSTAGVDTIVLIVKKYFPKTKESITCFLIDSVIIVGGIAITFTITKEIASYNIVMCFINVMTAIIAAVSIETINNMRSSSITFNIFSEKWEEINEYIIKNLDRGCTIYDVVGGYSNKERKELKTVVSKRQAEKAKEDILNIDPNCFLTMTVSKGVFGEGFQKRFSDD